MKKILVTLLFAMMLMGVNAQTVNDPLAQKREATNFQAISISNAFDVYLSQGSEEAVAVSASEEKYRDLIIVAVKNGVLTIGLEKSGWNWKGNKKLKAYISFKQLNSLNVSGACDVYVQGTLTADDLKLHLSGASDLKGKLNVKKLDVDLSGASDMTVTGAAGSIVVEASGASEFKGVDLISEVCNAKATGASDIRITVNKELTAHATGASDVKYKGSGVVKEMKTSGASSISKI